jgi:proline dehydrogenase
MYAGAKAIFYALSRSAMLKRLASKYGMRSRDSFARRFIAGESIDEAVEVSRGVQSQGLHLTLDYLGESVRTVEEADAATREYVRLLEVILASGIERNISLKLTQLGAGIDRATCVPAWTTCDASSTRRDDTASSCASTWRTRRGHK